MDIFKDHSKKLIIITTETSWKEIPRMRHHVALQLSKINNVLFVELDSAKQEQLYTVSDSIAVYVIGGYVRGLNKVNFIKSIYNRVQVYKIICLVKKLQAKRRIIINFKFDFYQIYLNKIWHQRYYFMNDDFVNMPHNKTLRKKESCRYIQNKTITFSDRIFLSGDALTSYIEDRRKKTTVIYSGHDFKVDKYKPIFNKRPILCFMGFVNNNLELEWIEALAAIDKYEIRLIGPIESAFIKVRFEALANIKLYDPLIGEELYHFLKVADAFLMPYKDLPVNTISSVPAKLFQYLACGKPIISNKLPNLIDLPDFFVYQASSVVEFLSSVDKALNDDNEKKFIRRISFASENTWDRRGELLNFIIDNDNETVN
jgi:glycosyltransferase involved in cell wall biosynthesis